MSEKPVNPSVLRDTFAVRYLQAGGDLEALRDLLGLTNVAALKRYERLSAHKFEHEQQQEPGEEHQSRAMATPRKKEAASEEITFGGNQGPAAASSRQL